MSNQQRSDGPPHHDHHPRDRNSSRYPPDPGYSQDSHFLTPPHYDQTVESERHRQYRPRDHDPQSYPPRNARKRDNRRHHVYGYGGTRSPSSPDRGSREIPQLRESNGLRQRYASMPPPRIFDRLLHNEPHRHESRKPMGTAGKSNSAKNPYKGGCPYSHAPAPVTERNLRAQTDSPGPLQKSMSLHNKTREDSSQEPKNTRQVSGPYKPVCSSLSPVKPANFRPPPIPKVSPVLPKPSGASRILSGSCDANMNSRKLDKPLLPGGPNAPVIKPNGRLQTDRRSSRTLSCEKIFTPKEQRLSGQRVLRGMTAPLECSAIARPAKPPSKNVPQVAIPHEGAQQNGSLSTLNNESSQTQGKETREAAEEVERMRNQFNGTGKNEFSIRKIFNKEPRRLPDEPEGDMSGGSYPTAIKKSDVNGILLKEDAQRVEVEPLKKKPPILRSVPAPQRCSTSGDTPQDRAGAAALQRAQREEHTDLKPRDDCRFVNGGRSSICATPRASYDAEPHSTANRLEGTVHVTRQRLASSMAKMNIVDEKENGSVSEQERSQEGANQDNRRKVVSNESGKDLLLHGGSGGPHVSKRRASDSEGFREPRAKRHRPSLPPETVNVDDTTILRRSRRFEQFETTKTWETIKFEPERVHKLFLKQLQDQPMLLRISFLGMSDGDLRTILDLWKGNDLPDPDQRLLEVNNNRIRRISDEMCTHFSALRVVSLNLSCNMLTTIGAKIGLSSKLKFLNVSRNRISSLPQELCDLTNLEVLNMSHNDISKLPSGLCRLERLEVLSLAWNKLEVLPEDIAAEGAVLSDLDLSHNESFHFFPRCAEHWTSLEVLHMPSTTIYKSLSRREHRLRPAALVKELAGRVQDMFNGRRMGLRSRS